MTIPLGISCILALWVKHVPLRVGRPPAQSQANKGAAQAGGAPNGANNGSAVQIEVVPSKTQPPLVSDNAVAGSNEASTQQAGVTVSDANAAPAETWQEIPAAQQPLVEVVTEGQQPTIAAAEVAVAVEVAQLATGSVAAEENIDTVAFHGSE